MEAIISQFFIAAILCLRCWALFGGSRVVLGALIAVYVCCLGLQIYPTVITFNLPLAYIEGVSEIGDASVACFMETYIALTMVNLGPWRIAGWIGIVFFDGVVMALTAWRAIRLRMSGIRVSIVESLLQDGIYYFAIVFGLNMATVIAYVSTQCAYQLVLQRMTQVLTVVMTSHMFLHLKGTNSRAREGAVSTNVVFGTLVDREKYTHDRYHSIFRSTDQSGVEVDDWKPGK